MSYMGTHNRLRATRGKASTYTCECGSEAREWAYIPSDREVVDRHGRRYSRDLDDYRPMCKPCHQRFDKSAITHCPEGHEYAGDNLIVDAGKRKCRTCVYARNRRWRAQNPMTPERRARRMELQRQRRAQSREAGAA